MATPFSKQCEILSDLWMNHRDDEELQDFIEYNDLGLPLAYILTSGLAAPVEESSVYIEETFNLLVFALGKDPEQEYNSLSDLAGFDL